VVGVYIVESAKMSEATDSQNSAQQNCALSDEWLLAALLMDALYGFDDTVRPVDPNQAHEISIRFLSNLQNPDRQRV
jgi:hypothetical protein